LLVGFVRDLRFSFWLAFAGKSTRATHLRFNPQPRVVLRALDKSLSNRILANILHGLSQTLVATEDVIKGFVLPDWARASQQLVDATGGTALDSFENLRECERPAVGVPQRGEQEVCVVRHDYGGVKMDSLTIVVKAVLKCKSASIGCEHQGTQRAESYE
jgi:hypothetical protein